MSQIQLDRQNTSQADTDPILRVRNLSVVFKKEYGIFKRRRLTIKAVDDISFDLGESEFFSIVGESGSGKTTVARSIMNLTEPNSGSIYYNQATISKLRGRSLLEYRKDVQMVYQDPFESLNPRQSVFNTIAMPLKYLKRERNHSVLLETVEKLLREVGLDPDEVMNRLPHQLSGGQKQRVNVARALAPDPKVLIADEPITMLDAAQRLNLLSLLRTLKEKRKLSVLMITHDLASAKLTSDRIMVMYLGKLVELGPTNSILSKPHHPYVELILSATPRLDRKPEDINVSWLEDSQDVRRGCVFRPRCKYATDICGNEEPKFEERSSSHFVACHNPLNKN